jgi:predicted TPR repeat methyltransferase
MSVSPEHVRDISEAVYRRKLDLECGKGTAKRTDDDVAAGIPGPNGKPRMSIRARAEAYDKLTRHYLAILGDKNAAD